MKYERVLDAFYFSVLRVGFGVSRVLSRVAVRLAGLSASLGAYLDRDLEYERLVRSRKEEPKDFDPDVIYAAALARRFNEIADEIARLGTERLREKEA